jgi:hypothetical protein
MNITKFIPWGFKIKSLYWVKKEKEIGQEIIALFDLIDTDQYKEARTLLMILWDKWCGEGPVWFHKEHVSQLVKAESMLDFLEAENTGNVRISLDIDNLEDRSINVNGMSWVRIIELTDSLNLTLKSK